MASDTNNFYLLQIRSLKKKEEHIAFLFSPIKLSDNVYLHCAVFLICLSIWKGSPTYTT